MVSKYISIYIYILFSLLMSYHFQKLKNKLLEAKNQISRSQKNKLLEAKKTSF